MNDEIVKLLAEYHWREEEYPTWAIKCLEKGYDSKSLRILASMSKWDSASELDTYLQRTLKELGWDKIEKQDYLLVYAKILAKEIIEDKTDPVKASQAIYKIWVDLEYPQQLDDWSDIDEMIGDSEYFLKTGNKGFFFRPKEELISEIKKLSEELLKS